MNAFDNREYTQYTAEAKQRWGKTSAYKEYEQKSRGRSKEKSRAIFDGIDSILHAFSLCMMDGASPDSGTAQSLVSRLQAYITENFYACTTPILAGLGQMYIADERFKSNIDHHGEGTTAFISKAIEIYCAQTD